MHKFLFTILLSVSSIWINGMAENIIVNEDESFGSSRIYYQSGGADNLTVAHILNYRAKTGYNIGDFAFGALSYG